VVAGGYLGGETYLRSVEMLPTGAEAFVPCAPMSVPRTGFGLAYGPDGCVYAAGE
jgi:hypothetical protein